METAAELGKCPCTCIVNAIPSLSIKIEWVNSPQVHLSIDRKIHIHCAFLFFPKLTAATYMEEKAPAHQLIHHHHHHAAQLQQLELRGDTAITNSEEQDLKPPPGIQVGCPRQF